jgi:predicted transposase YbfD/YdcC
MDDKPISIWSCFRTLRDPRRSQRQKKHKLLDIVAIALCAVIAGADDWPHVVTFAKERRDWLKTFLDLTNGVPSRKTFERVFAGLAPHGLQSCLLLWLHHCTRGLGLDHIAIDGKTLRHSGNAAAGLGALHLVSAWATKAGLSLGQVAVDAKSNEITAIPLLLRLLNLEGALVTIDAMGCQKDIAAQVVDAGGDYGLTVKENQPGLYGDILDTFAQAQEDNFAGWDWDCYQSEERGHGRLEKRSYTVLYDLDGIADRDSWKHLRVIGLCYSERTVGEETTEEMRLFIGSRRASAKSWGGWMRGHWGIENGLHWHLDLSFGEDDSCIHDRNAAENFALLRKWALVLLKRHPSQDSIAVKRYNATLNPDFIQKVLKG